MSALPSALVPELSSEPVKSVAAIVYADEA